MKQMMQISKLNTVLSALMFFSFVAIISAAPQIANAASAIKIVVNNIPITSLDLQRRKALLRLQRTKGNISKEARKQLIEEAVKVAEIRRVKSGVSQAEVDAAFARFAASNRMKPGQLASVLGRAGVGAKHFKSFISVQMSWPRLVQARYGSAISKQDILSQILARGEDKPKTTEYVLQQIIFVIPKAKRRQAMARRIRDANAMRARFTTCDKTKDFARGLVDVTVRNLGRVMQPALPPDWKPFILKAGAGQVTPVRKTEKGVEFLAVCSAKQVSDDLAAETIIRSQAKAPLNSNDTKYLKELMKKARIYDR